MKLLLGAVVAFVAVLLFLRSRRGPGQAAPMSTPTGTAPPALIVRPSAVAQSLPAIPTAPPSSAPFVILGGSSIGAARPQRGGASRVIDFVYL